jgi:hypothetical protein
LCLQCECAPWVIILLWLLHHVLSLIIIIHFIIIMHGSQVGSHFFRQQCLKLFLDFTYETGLLCLFDKTVVANVVYHVELSALLVLVYANYLSADVNSENHCQLECNIVWIKNACFQVSMAVQWCSFRVMNLNPIDERMLRYYHFWQREASSFKEFS